MAKLKRIDLNVDLGEGMPWDAELMKFATSVNIGCGAHAGSFRNTVRTVILAQNLGLNVGAHPGYPDREHFGRQSPDETNREAWMRSVLAQLDQMVNLTTLDYIKPHGALYHDLARGDAWCTEPFTEWLAKHELPLMGLAGTEHERIAEEAEVQLISEGFVERGYLEDGSLAPRSMPGAILTDLAIICNQAKILAELGFKTLCVHGDREDAATILSSVREALEQEGYVIGHES